MKFEGKNQEYFELIDITPQNCRLLKASRKNELSLIWFASDGNRLIIDSIEHTFNTNDILCLTEFHQIETVTIKELKLLRFNKPFYCILDHDSEVGCKGILYFGSSTTPIIQPAIEELEILETTWKMLVFEMKSADNLQLEMLQMMLKRILILCTRIYKRQQNYTKIDPGNNDLVRSFNYLVETNFKEKHTVADYAALLHKSPKTLSNLFKKMGNTTPLKFIQARIMLEAHRLLKYTDKSISDIGYEIGFNDVQTFSRFFKKNQGVSPVDFRNSA